MSGQSGDAGPSRRTTEESTRPRKRQRLSDGDEKLVDTATSSRTEGERNTKLKTYGRRNKSTRPPAQQSDDSSESGSVSARPGSSAVSVENGTTQGSTKPVSRTKTSAVSSQRPSIKAQSPQTTPTTSHHRPAPISQAKPPSMRKKPNSVSDLAQVFDLIPKPLSTGPARRSPVKAQIQALGKMSATPESERISRRMLSRSKTDTSLPATPSKGEKPTTRSLPCIPPNSSTSSRIFSEPRPPEESKPDQELDPSMIASSSTTMHTDTPPSLARTYSGRSRSFLISVSSSQYGVIAGNDSSHALGGPDPLPEETEEVESYTSLRARLGVDRSDDDRGYAYTFNSPATNTPAGAAAREEQGYMSDLSPLKAGAAEYERTDTLDVLPSLPEGMMNDLRSTTELRSKGESQKFMDDVGYLFEGLEKGSSRSSKRSSALEIVKRLCNLEFFKKAIATDFCGQTLEILHAAGAGGGGDQVLDCIFLIFLWQVSRDGPSWLDLILRPHPASTSTLTTTSEDESSSLSWLKGLCSNEVRDKDILHVCTTVSRKDINTKQLSHAGFSRGDRSLLLSLQDVARDICRELERDEISTVLLATQILAAISPTCMGVEQSL